MCGAVGHAYACCCSVPVDAEYAANHASAGLGAAMPFLMLLVLLLLAVLWRL